MNHACAARSSCTASFPPRPTSLLAIWLAKEPEFVGIGNATAAKLAAAFGDGLHSVLSVDSVELLTPVIGETLSRQLLSTYHERITEASAARSGGNTVRLQDHYASTSATVYQLINTLSHEYTHLDVAGASFDAGRTGESLSLYVSYGTGGLTENLAAGEQLYCFEIPKR